MNPGGAEVHNVTFCNHVICRHYRSFGQTHGRPPHEKEEGKQKVEGLRWTLPPNYVTLQERVSSSGVGYEYELTNRGSDVS